MRSLTRTLLTTIPLIGLIVAGWVFLLFGQGETVSAEERALIEGFETDFEGREDRQALSAVRIGWTPPIPGVQPRAPRDLPKDAKGAQDAGAQTKPDGEPEGDKPNASEDSAEGATEEGGAKPPVTANDKPAKPAKPPYPPPLVREALTAELAAQFYATLKRKRFVFDPLLYVRSKSNQEWPAKHADHPDGGWTVKTNDRGFFGTSNVREEAPDVRIVVTGDMQTVGKCAPAESWVELLQGRLQASDPERQVEALNAAQNGYNLYNYVGAIEKYRTLKPDVFVVVVFGGNDFAGSMPLYRHFGKLEPGKTTPRDPAKLFAEDAELHGAGAQEMAQILHFANNPEDVDRAKDLLVSMTAQVVIECRKRKITPFFVYLPPSLRGQPKFTQELATHALEVAKMPERALEVSGEIADSWIQFMRQNKIGHIDMRGIFRGFKAPLYWTSDQHLNLEGHKVMAQALERSIESVLLGERR